MSTSQFLNTSTSKSSGVATRGGQFASLRSIPQAGPGRVLRISVEAQLAIKRAIDIFLAVFLLILLAPVFAVCSLLVALSSPGAIMFVQSRVGQNRRRARGGSPAVDRRVRSALGPEFKIFKFRTMYSDAAPYSSSPLDSNDARITRLGKLLRTTCLDEIPQLLNVLGGEMTLVGPRPEMPFWVAQYDEVQRRRLTVKPGITGLWQIMGPRDRPIHHAVEYDLYYIENWSLYLDLKILMKTLAFAFGVRNR